MTRTETRHSEAPSEAPTARPWWKHPAFWVAVVVLMAAAVLALGAWLALRGGGTDVAQLRVEAPDTVTMEEDFAVTVTALDAQGEPVSEALVTLRSNPALMVQPENRVVTDADGVATFAGLEAAQAVEHTLTAAVNGTATEFRIEAVEPARIRMEAPSEVAVNEAFAVDVAFLRGDEPVEGREVTVYVEPEGPFQSVTTGANGTAEVVFSDGVAEPGEYTLLAMTPEGPTEATQSLEVVGADGS